MRMRYWLSLALIGFSMSAHAQVGQIPNWPPATVVSGATYQGPCDLQTCIVAAGFRAMYAAKIGSNIVTMFRTSDSTSQNFAAQASGFLDEAAVTTFCGAANANGCSGEMLDQTGSGPNFQVFSTTDNVIRQSALGTHTCGKLGIAGQGYFSSAAIAQSGAVTAGFVLANVNTSTNTFNPIVGSFTGRDYQSLGFGNVTATNSGTLQLTLTTVGANPWGMANIIDGASSVLLANSLSQTGTGFASWNSSDGLRMLDANAGGTADVCEVYMLASDIGASAAAALIANQRGAAAWNF